MDANFKGLKVLLIDDSKTIRNTTESLLKKTGCAVTSAVDGFDALCKIVDADPDLIFMDIMMPRLDGFETCALIKSNAKFKNVPIILLSSQDGLLEQALAQLVGADHYLTKPFNKAQLFSAISRYAKVPNSQAQTSKTSVSAVI